MRIAPLLFMFLSLSLALPADAAKLYFIDTATAKVQRANRNGSNDFIEPVIEGKDLAVKPFPGVVFRVGIAALCTRAASQQNAE